jgi:hypothetical protein
MGTRAATSHAEREATGFSLFILVPVFNCRNETDEHAWLDPWRLWGRTGRLVAGSVLYLVSVARVAS